MYLDYLQTFGAEEIFGIINADFENSSVPDAIWYTLSKRKEIQLPSNLLVIYETGNGELICLDFNQLDEKGEPKLVSYMLGYDIEIQTYEIFANDFGDFLLDLVKQEI